MNSGQFKFKPDKIKYLTNVSTLDSSHTKIIDDINKKKIFLPKKEKKLEKLKCMLKELDDNSKCIDNYVYLKSKIIEDIDILTNEIEEIYNHDDEINYFSKTYNKGYVFSPYANKEIYLLSGLEISYATWLNKNNIKWDKPKSISYQLNGKSKKYYPDFLLVDSNEIIEIKGYWWSGDKEKMLAVTTQNPNLDIKILTSKELNKLGIKSIRADTSL
jgi:hypothetical protein